MSSREVLCLNRVLVAHFVVAGGTSTSGLSGGKLPALPLLYPEGVKDLERNTTSLPSQDLSRHWREGNVSHDGHTIDTSESRQCLGPESFPRSLGVVVGSPPW